jgi:DNA-binding beta-propeller fold protein YncE
MFFTVSTFAGAGGVGTADGPVATATFARPSAITVSPSGIVYIVETVLNGIRKIEAGVVSTLASRTRGYQDGDLSTTALFNEPGGIVSDHTGNLYLADTNNHRIRKIDTTAGKVTTVAGPFGSQPLQGWADGPLDGVLFNYPDGIAIDPADSTLYVTELHRIRRIPLKGDDIVYTVAAVGIAGFADGPATLAQFNEPLDVAVTQIGDLFVADSVNFRIRRVSPSGTVSTVAGDGVPAVSTDKPEFVDDRPALNARFEAINGIAVASSGLGWVADGTHVRMYSPITGTVSTACSDRGTHQQPIEFQDAVAIAILGNNILVVDNGANQIIQLTPQPD